jgi:shikimate kinase
MKIIGNSQQHIFLVGFMACGKSTVGPLLAERLGRAFIDLDHEIEAAVGCTIGELIAREGEAGFRRIETATLKEIKSRPAAVLAPGGGAITIDENRALMAGMGAMVWLDAPFELCWQRIMQDAVVRPLAASKEAAFDRYQSRLNLYQLAGLRLPIEAGQAPAEIADAIQRLLI